MDFVSTFSCFVALSRDACVGNISTDDNNHAIKTTIILKLYGNKKKCEINVYQNLIKLIFSLI